jgi:membrane associated rhomboid family serine protease
MFLEYTGDRLKKRIGLKITSAGRIDTINAIIPPNGMKGTSCPLHTREVHRELDRKGFLNETFNKVRFVDLLLIYGVLIPLFWIQLRPDSVRRTLVLDYADPSLMSVYTTHFVHINWAHLLGNVGGYVLVVSVGYLLSVLSNRRRHFRIVFVLAMTVVPLCLSVMGLITRNHGIGMGFSGILMALFAYFSLVLIAFLAVRFSETLHLDHAFRLFLIGLIFSVLLTTPFGNDGTFPVLGLALLGSALALSLLRTVSIVSFGSIRRNLRRTGYTELALGSLVLFVFVGFVAFSGGSVGDGSSIATDIHAFGFVSGFGLSYVVLRTGCSVSHIRHCARPGSDCELHDSLLTRSLRTLLPPPRRPPRR